jgi:insulysin
MAAASLDVHVGSLSDPEETQGLAHFLEHMLFMGTEKYPEENYYDSFLKKNAGSANAYTSGEDTNYHFSVSKDQLHHTLDVFGQFFISPLFSETCTEREMNAVDSEHKKNIKNDAWRFYDLVKSTAKPGSTATLFSTGCLETLQQPGIRDSLIAFYKKHYSANHMALVVLGAETLDELEAYVTEIFSAVPNHNYPQLYQSTPVPFDSTVMGTVTRLVPIKNLNELKLLWIWPSVVDLYETKPHRYLSHLIGHEGRGSLLSMLRGLNYATELSAGSEGYQYKNYSGFFVHIDLTDQGLAEYLTVLRIIGAYIAMLRQKGVQDWVFEENKLMSEAEFHYKSKTQPMNLVSRLSRDLHRYPTDLILTGPELFFSYDPVKVREFLDVMTPDNCRVYLVSQSFASQTDQTSRWYGTQYKIEPFSPEILEALSAQEYSHPNYALDLPPKNPYIPTDLEVLPSGSESLPKLIFQAQGQSVWHKQDDTFKRNKVIGALNIETNEQAFPYSDFTRLCAKIWIKLFYEKFREEDYMASQAGLRLRQDIETKGISIIVSGFSQKFSKYYQSILEAFVNLELTEADQKLFEIHVRDVELGLDNHFYSQPYNQVFSKISDIRLVHGYSTIASMRKILPKITLQDIIQFNKLWLANPRLEWLVTGNITAEETLEMTDNCAQIIKRRATDFMSEDDRTGLRHLQYPLQAVQEIASRLFFEEYLVDSTQPDSAVLCEWQYGHADLQEHAALLSIESYLKEPCFNVLRTQEQLGYLVFSGLSKRRLIVSYYIVVESPVASGAKLTQRVSAFMQKMVLAVQEITQEILNENTSSVYKRLTKKDTSLREQFEYYHNEMQAGSYDFERRSKLAEAVQNLTIENFLATFNKLFLTHNRRLDIELVSHAHRTEQEAEATDRTKITNVAEFRRTLAMFPEVVRRL